MEPFADVILVNWNSGPRLRRCLESLVSTPADTSLVAQVIVVDNASTDRSADGLDGLWPRLIVLRNQENRGFAAACNQGARVATGELLLFLNPDSRLEANSIALPMLYLAASGNERIGICGIQLLDQQGRVVPICMRFPTPVRFLAALFGLARLFPTQCPGYRMTDWDHDEARTVEAVIGAFFLVRRSVFESLEGFDEHFFLYFEEVDFCWRASQAGWQTAYVAEAQAYHEGSARWDHLDAWKLFHSARSRIMYSFLHFPTWAATLYTLGLLLVEPCSRLAINVSQGSARDAGQGFKAYARLWKDLPGIVKEAVRR